MLRRYFLCFACVFGVNFVCNTTHAAGETLTMREADMTATYSDAVQLSATLQREGMPLVDGEVVFVLHDGETEVTRLIGYADDAGLARARLELVDGRHGFDVKASDAGQPGYTYSLRAQHLPLDGSAEAFAEGTLRVLPETTLIEMNALHTAAPGTPLIIDARLVDADGDVAAGSTDSTGRAPRGLAGRTLSLYLDADGDGQPALDERVLRAETDAEGWARFERAPSLLPLGPGAHDGALLVRFGGDVQYAFAGAASDLVIRAGPPDMANTRIDAPATLSAASLTTAEVHITLVDASGAPFSADVDPVALVLETSLGRVTAPVRDVQTGSYTATFTADGTAGDAVLTLTAPGVPGRAQVTIRLEAPAGCSTGGHAGPVLATLLFLAALAALGRRRGGQPVRACPDGP